MTTNVTYEKPLPSYTMEQAPFWEYAKKHELRMQKCVQCGFIRYPSSIICPKCHSTAAPEWVNLSGRGKVYSFVVFDYVYDKAFAKEVPYVTAAIELAEGPRIMSNVTGVNPRDVRIDMPVEVYFDSAAEGFAIPKFKPVKA